MMTRHHLPRRLLAVAMTGSILCGCGSNTLLQPTLATRDEYGKFAHRHEDQNSAYYLHPLPIDLDDLYKKGEKWGGGKYWERQGFRNYAQNELLRRSDQICTQYMTRVVYAYAAENVATQSVQGLLVGVKAITGVTDFLQNVAVVGPGTISPLTSSEILKYEFFKKLNSKIIESRRSFRVAIRKAQALPVPAANTQAKAYSLSQAVYDAERYHSLCNYPMAFALGDAQVTEENEPVIPTTADEARTNIKMAADAIAKDVGKTKPDPK